MEEKLEKVDAIVREIHVKAGMSSLMLTTVHNGKEYSAYAALLKAAISDLIEIRDMAFQTANLLAEFKEENMPKKWWRWW